MSNFAASEATAHRTPFTAGTTSWKRPLRSVGAVTAGLLFTFAITTAVDLVLHALGVFPAFEVRMSDALFILALAYRVPFNVGGSYVAARLAPRSPERHALVLGGIGVVLSTVGAIVMWEHGPGWYSIANIVIALPCAWAGARIFGR
jgi:hypothetical protein